MGKEPIQPQDKYVLRLPDGMRERIKAAAEKSNRSMNAEIVATLEDKYPAPQVNFELVAFLEEWIMPLSEATSAEDRAKIVAEANEFARSHNQNIVTTVKERTASGKVEAFLKMGDLEMVLNLWDQPGSGRFEPKTKPRKKR